MVSNRFQQHSAEHSPKQAPGILRAPALGSKTGYPVAFPPKGVRGQAHGGRTWPSIRAPFSVRDAASCGRRVARHRLQRCSFDDLVVIARGASTRSHSELGREDPQRRWYCVLRRGRVGRCQANRAQGSEIGPHRAGIGRQAMRSDDREWRAGTSGFDIFGSEPLC